MRRSLLTLATVALVVPTAVADDKKDPSKADVGVKLVARTSSYKLDLGGMTAEDFEKAVKAAAKGEGRMPKSPAVDLVLEIRNNTKEDIKLWASGDPVTLNLKLAGPGAVSGRAQRAFTREFRLPREVTLAPGKTHSIEIKGLSYGFRGVSEQAFWTKAGDYTLTASFTTALNPPPKDVKADESGFGKATLTSAPVKIKITEK